MQLLSNELKILFLRVFEGTPDSATVTSGTATPSDALVLHMVVRAQNSYIRRRMNVPVDVSRAGNTYNNSTWIGSEFYLFVNGQPLIEPSRRLARIAFHEGLHNVTRWEDFRLHGPDGGDGLAASDPGAGSVLTPTNCTLMRNGLRNPGRQLL